MRPGGHGVVGRGKGRGLGGRGQGAGVRNEGPRAREQGAGGRSRAPEGKGVRASFSLFTNVAPPGTRRFFSSFWIELSQKLNIYAL